MRKEGVVAAGDNFAYFFFFTLFYRSVDSAVEASFCCPDANQLHRPIVWKRVQYSWSSRQTGSM